MWILLVGPCTERKASVANYLQESEGFEAIDYELPHGSEFFRQLSIMISLLSKQTEVQDDTTKKYVLTNSVWETHLVFNKIFSRLGILTDDEYSLLNHLYEFINQNLTPPRLVLHVSDDLISILPQSKDSPYGQEFHSVVYSEYESFLSQIRVSTAEIDMRKDFESVQGDIDNAIKFMGSVGVRESIWKEGFTKGAFCGP